MLQSPNIKYERSPSPQTECNRYLNPGDLSGHVGKYDYSPSDKHCITFFAHLFSYVPRKQNVSSWQPSQIQTLYGYLFSPLPF